jgi:hypothetical protein
MESFATLALDADFFISGMLSTEFDTGAFFSLFLKK